MLIPLVLILSLPVICYTKIKIEITVAAREIDVDLTCTGEDNKIATEHERDLFNLTTENLNRGMRVELGRVPEAIFLKDPTPYGNLFKKYKWPEAKRNLQVKKVKVFEIMNEEVVLKTHEHINNSSEATKIYRSLYQNVESTVRSTWSNSGLPSEDIFYDVVINFGDSAFKYQNKWRERTLRDVSVKVGVKKKGIISIEPGHTVVTELIALKTVISIKVVYKSQIIGNLIGDYEDLYGKYHFWSPTIRNIMNAAKLKNNIQTIEYLDILCYTEPKLRMYDKDTGEIVKSVGSKRLFWKLIGHNKH